MSHIKEIISEFEEFLQGGTLRLVINEDGNELTVTNAELQIKSFLRQSHLKYLQSQEKRLEEEKNKLTMKWDADKHQSWVYDKELSLIRAEIKEIIILATTSPNKKRLI